MLSIEKQILYLISQTEGMEVKLLLTIYEARGISDQIIRNALTKLKKEEYIETPVRSYYVITDLGQKFIQNINCKPFLYEQKWDGMWQIAMFEIPETERKKRDALRNYLGELGFAALYKGVYISPRDYQSEVVKRSQYDGMSDRVTVVKGEFLHHSLNQEKIYQLWNLGEVRALYQSKMTIFEDKIKATSDKLLKSSQPSELALFTAFLHLGDLMGELVLVDPMLPKELLPKDWLGDTYYREFQGYLQVLASAIHEDSSYYPFVRGFAKY